MGIPSPGLSKKKAVTVLAPEANEGDTCAGDRSEVQVFGSQPSFCATSSGKLSGLFHYLEEQHVRPDNPGHSSRRSEGGKEGRGGEEGEQV